MSKYEIGQQIPVGGIITITGACQNKQGTWIYNTDRKASVPEHFIESLEMKPLEKAQPEQPKQEDKRTYKAGNKVKVVDNTCGHFAKIGGVITLKNNDVQAERNAWHFKEGAGYITECDIEPYAEPKQEPVKLYCVAENCPGRRLTKGKIYETDADGYITYDDGQTSTYEHGSYDWKNTITGISACLVPLVSRPAEVGEWVYIKNKIGDYTYNVGDIGEVEKLTIVSGAIRAFGGEYIDWKEYLVLDGYKPEPECYNGKVICVANNASRWFTVGKVYEVKNGVLNDDDGKFDYNPLTPAKTLEQLNVEQVPRFIEFKGEWLWIL